MKTLLRGTVAAIALVGFAGIANAGPNVVVHETGTSGVDFYVGGAGGVNTPAVGNNADTAVTTVSNQYTITGNVTKDCSMYTGTPGGARTIDIGQIGVRTADDTVNSDAFEMVSPIEVQITSWNAGCNFNNTVSLAKSAAGLVNSAPGGYDNAQFQANIPYTLSALFTAPTSQSGPAGAPGQNLQVGLNGSSASGNYGAWRSRLALIANAPQVTDKALVAGTYQDTITVTLAAN